MITPTTSAIGTTRRIQGLLYIGRTYTEQADRIGMRISDYRLLTHQAAVTIKTAQLVADMHADLWTETPPDTAASRRARVIARQQGFFSTLAWDDIDVSVALPCVIPRIDPDSFAAHMLKLQSDPDVDELTVQRVYAGHPIPVSPAVRGELLRRMLFQGYRRDHMATVFGTNVKNISSHMYRYGLTKVIDVISQFDELELAS